MTAKIIFFMLSVVKGTIRCVHTVPLATKLLLLPSVNTKVDNNTIG